MTRHRLTLLALLALLPAKAGATPADLCRRAAHLAAAETGVPEEVLLALTLTETGRGAGSAMEPWPWAVNHAGAGQWARDSAEAEGIVTEILAGGATNVDLGCFQLNWRWHGANFASVAAMLEPEANARYAAELVAAHYDRSGSWTSAAGAFHSATPEKAERYLERFTPILTTLLETPLPEPEPQDRPNRFALLRPGPAGAAGSLVPRSDGAGPLFGAP